MNTAPTLGARSIPVVRVEDPRPVAREGASHPGDVRLDEMEARGPSPGDGHCRHVVGQRVGGFRPVSGIGIPSMLLPECVVDRLGVEDPGALSTLRRSASRDEPRVVVPAVGPKRPAAPIRLGRQIELRPRSPPSAARLDRHQPRALLLGWRERRVGHPQRPEHVLGEVCAHV